MKDKISPMEATERELCCITRDNFDVGDFSIFTDSWEVSLSEQTAGEPRKQHIAIDRAVFNKLVRWYLRPQAVVRKPI